MRFSSLSQTCRLLSLVKVSSEALLHDSFSHGHRVIAPHSQQLQRRVFSSNELSERADNGKASSQDVNLEPVSLPLAQRSKNILAAHWRGQLSTVKAGADQKDERSVHGSVVLYSVFDGKPVVWVPGGDTHEVNLLLDDRGSLLVGHLDPPLATIRSFGKVLPRVILLGDFVGVENSEMAHLRRRLQKQVEALQMRQDERGPESQSFLHSAGFSRDERLQTLNYLSSPTNNLSAYRLYARSCHFVDFQGGRHSLKISDVAGAATDPLAGLQTALVEGINRNDLKRRALILFCAAYMQVEVQDVYLFSIDKWGFNILAQPIQESDSFSEGGKKESLWREFRFMFNYEVRDVNAFCTVFLEMEKEVMAASDGKGGQ